jgi:ketol-acid reductoisomerase
MDDCKNDHKWLIEQREAINNHQIEETGARIRSMFSWL